MLKKNSNQTCRRGSQKAHSKLRRAGRQNGIMPRRLPWGGFIGHNGMMLFGADVFFSNARLLRKLKGRRAGFLGHSASVTKGMRPSLSCLLSHPDIHITAVFSPQHGYHSEKQANMIVSEDGKISGIPLFSLYSSQTRRLTRKMKEAFDILIIDLQDTGCRVYTYLTTVLSLLEDCEEVILLDRPNPIGRNVEGPLLNPEYKSFVGHASLPMAHGLTLGEAALWHKAEENLSVSLQVIPMRGYSASGGWPGERPWVLPSPNMPSLAAARLYPGAVLLEGTAISEGRGTALPFQLMGFPKMRTEKIKRFMEKSGKAFLRGAALREASFEPVFDIYRGALCQGFQIHLEPLWAGRGRLRPFRLISLFLKAFRHIHPEVSWKLPPPYEYEAKKLPIDILSGGPELREWVESSSLRLKPWDDFLRHNEELWKKAPKAVSVVLTPFDRLFLSRGAGPEISQAERRQ